MAGGQGHRGHVGQQVRVWFERDALGVGLNPKTSAQGRERGRQPGEVVLRARRTNVDVNSGVARLVQSSGDSTDDHEGDTVFGQDTADLDDVATSSSLGCVTHQPVALAQPCPVVLAQGPFPVGNDIVVVVPLRELQPQIEARPRQQLEQGRQRRLAAP